MKSGKRGAGVIKATCEAAEVAALDVCRLVCRLFTGGDDDPRYAGTGSARVPRKKEAV